MCNAPRQRFLNLSARPNVRDRGILPALSGREYRGSREVGRLDGVGCAGGNYSAGSLIRLGIEMAKSARVSPRATSNKINIDRVSLDSRHHDIGDAAQRRNLSANFVGITRAWVTVLSMRCGYVR